MKMLKMLPKLTVILLTGMSIAGCVVVDYDASYNGEIKLGNPKAKKYQVASAEYITVLNPSEGKNGLKLLNMTMNNKPGNSFSVKWDKTVAQMKENPANYEFHLSEISAWKLNTRTVAPTLFELNKGEPVNVRAVIFIRPEKVNPWLTASFLLTASILSPIESRSYGAASVTVLDKSGKTISTKTIILQRQVWFSTLFPWALLGVGNFSIKAAGTSPDMDENTLKVRLMSSVVADILSSPSGKTDSTWGNIRSAAVEAIACDNSDAALNLLKTASKQNIGGEEQKQFLKVLE